MPDPVTGAGRSTIVNLVSFGFRHGLPRAADLVFDVRFLPNPHFEAELRPKTGEHAPVAEYVLKNERATGFLARLRDLLDFLLPLAGKFGHFQQIAQYGETCFIAGCIARLLYERIKLGRIYRS